MFLEMLDHQAIYQAVSESSRAAELVARPGQLKKAKKHHDAALVQMSQVKTYAGGLVRRLHNIIRGLGLAIAVVAVALWLPFIAAKLTSSPEPDTGLAMGITSVLTVVSFALEAVKPLRRRIGRVVNHMIMDRLKKLIHRIQGA
jgi:hypothetical protein